MLKRTIVHLIFNENANQNFSSLIVIIYLHIPVNFNPRFLHFYMLDMFVYQTCT